MNVAVLGSKLWILWMISILHLSMSQIDANNHPPHLGLHPHRWKMLWLLWFSQSPGFSPLSASPPVTFFSLPHCTQLKAGVHPYGGKSPCQNSSCPLRDLFTRRAQIQNSTSHFPTSCQQSLRGSWSWLSNPNPHLLAFPSNQKILHLFNSLHILDLLLIF